MAKESTSRHILRSIKGLGNQIYFIPVYSGGRKLGKKARDLWRAICYKSALEIQPLDTLALSRLIFMVDQFERAPSKQLAEEIRLLAKQFGLNKDEIGRFIT